MVDHGRASKILIVLLLTAAGLGLFHLRGGHWPDLVPAALWSELFPAAPEALPQAVGLQAEPALPVAPGNDPAAAASEAEIALQATEPQTELSLATPEIDPAAAGEAEFLAAWPAGADAPPPEPFPVLVFSGPVDQRCLGPACFSLPAVFQVVSGRLQLLCQGRPSLTRVQEIPAGRPGSLADLIPPGPQPYSLAEAEAEFGRPALWAFGSGEPGLIQAHLVLDFQGGAVVLSRLLPEDRLEEERAAFAAEAGRFTDIYAWGRAGAGPEEKHSLYGHLRLDQSCRRFQGQIRLAAPEAVLEIAWPSELTARPKAPEVLGNQRLLRSGTRWLGGRPGQEWAALGRDPASGELVLAAVWRPEAEEEAVLFLSAPAPFADLALGYWEAVLDSARFPGAAPEAGASK